MTPSRLLFVFLLLAGIVIAPGYVDNVDSRIILRTAERLVDAGTWGMGDVEGTYMGSLDYGARGPDGQHQMKFGPGNALLDVPFVVAGRAVLVPLGLSKAQAGDAGASLAAALWFAVCGWFLYRIARRHADERGAVAATVCGVFGTYLVVYGKSAYLELPLAAALAGAFLAAIRVREGGGARAGAALGLACVVVLWIKFGMLALVAGTAPILLSGGLRDRVRALAAGAGVFAAGLLAFGWLNQVRFGSPFATGYATSVKFVHDLGSGVVELLVSPAGGMLPYAPLLVLAAPGIALLARRDGALALGLVLALAASFLVYGTWCSPLGGDVWGPRYMVPVTALLAVPAGLAAVRWARAGGWRGFAAAALVAGSAALQVPPLLVSFQEVYSLRERRLAAPEAPAPQRLTARILAEKIRSPDDSYDLARLGLGAGRHTPGRVERGPNLWPARIQRDLPHRAALGWTAWGIAAAALTATGALLLRAPQDERA